MSFLDHTWEHSLGNDEWSIEVDVDDLLEVCDRHLCHRDTLDDTSVVDQDVDHAEFLLDVSHHLLHLLLVSYITDITLGINALSLIVCQCLIHVLLATAVESNLSTSLGVSLSDSKTDTVSGTCHEGNLTLQ